MQKLMNIIDNALALLFFIAIIPLLASIFIIGLILMSIDTLIGRRKSNGGKARNKGNGSYYQSG